jgi:hypothetical protein
MGNLISGSHVIRKDVVFQVGPDLRDPCVRTILSFWILHAGIHGASRGAYDPWWAPWNQDRRDRQLRGAGLAPFTRIGCLSCWLMQPPFKHSVRDQGRGGGLGGQVVCHCVLCTGDVSQVQDFEVLFQLMRMEQVGCQLGSLQQHSPLTCFMMSWESPFTRSRRTPSDNIVLNP